MTQESAPVNDHQHQHGLPWWVWILIIGCVVLALWYFVPGIRTAVTKPAGYQTEPTVIPVYQPVQNTPIPDPTVVPAPVSNDSAPAVSFWGPAGAAPQSLDEAVNTLGLTSNVKPFVTNLYPAPGDTRTIGWIVGTNESAANGTTFTVSLPAGTTVDYDPNVSTLTGKTVVVVDLAKGWQRALMAENGSITSLKVTVYWTPFGVGEFPYTIVSGTLPK